MQRRTLLSTLAAVAFSAGLSGAAAPALAEGSSAYFTDILYLQDGKTAADAVAYFEAVIPIVAEHGLVPVTPHLSVTAIMAGDIEPDMVHVWAVADPQNTFDQIFSDPAYLAHVAERDSTFDMKRSHMFMLQVAN